jgi:excisionase family DNA binding protein
VFNLKNKTALVTGGASGIGAAIAEIPRTKPKRNQSRRPDGLRFGFEPQLAKISRNRMVSTTKESKGELTTPAVLLSAADSTSGVSTTRLAFSVKETANMLGLSEKTIRRLVARRLLRSSRALRHLLIPRKEIERFLDQTTVT